MTRVGSSTLLKVCPACNDNIAFNSQWQFDRLFSCQSPFWLVVVESPVAQYGHVWFRPSGIHPLCRYTVAAAAAVQNKFWLWRFICTLLTKRRKSYINLLGHEKLIKILHFGTWFYLRRFKNKILEHCKRIINENVEFKKLMFCT